jgi:hypothetical protein
LSELPVEVPEELSVKTGTLLTCLISVCRQRRCEPEVLFADAFATFCFGDGVGEAIELLAEVEAVEDLLRHRNFCWRAGDDDLLL